MYTYEPLPGVLCPLCKRNPVESTTWVEDRKQRHHPVQTFQWSDFARAWLCPNCKTPYQDACELSNTAPYFRQEANQTPIAEKKGNQIMQAETPATPAIYVDEIINWDVTPAPGAARFFGNGKPSCHMSTPDHSPGGIEQLHQFAEKIGMKRAWFQNHTIMPHYDLTPSKRAMAVKRGAIEVSCIEIVNLCNREGVKRMPRKNTAPAPMQLSHSQLEMWEQCQYRWRLKKIDKVQAAPSEALIFGTALHAALEADGRQAMKSWAMVDYEMLGEFDRSMQEEIAKSDPYSLLPKARHIAMRARAQDIITRYIEKIQPTFKPLAVEQDFTLVLDNAVEFRGRIDAITATSIVDWKTASSPWTPGEQDDKDQATAYLIARPEASKVSFAVFSGEGDGLRFQSLPTARTEAQKQEYIKKVHRISREIMDAKGNDEFAANPGIGKGVDGKWLGNCHRCEVLGACTAGQAWLKLKGRVPAVPVITPRAVEKYAESQAEAANDVTE